MKNKHHNPSQISMMGVIYSSTELKKISRMWNSPLLNKKKYPKTWSKFDRTIRMVLNMIEELNKKEETL